jgi:hypothetical protein
VFQFRYEDMVQNPDVIAKMLKFSGLDTCEEVFNPESTYVGKGPGGTERTRPVDVDSLESWKTQLNAAEATAIMRVASPLAEAFGYS